MKDPAENEVRDEATTEERPENGATPNGPVVLPSARRAEEIHRELTRMERFRAKLERQPRRRLYVGLLLFTWFSLTVLISLDSRPLVSLGLSQQDRGYEVGSVVEEDVYAQRSVT